MCLGQLQLEVSNPLMESMTTSRTFSMNSTEDLNFGTTSIAFFLVASIKAMATLAFTSTDDSLTVVASSQTWWVWDCPSK